ncbi:MAG TPA: 1,4-dihydroxy-2-naphthoate polyprenyltransferase [Thermoanaerobaculia bacterium]|nr:1,4-dihydroxy-2-naphthoate polyprenyltransferase [Thermoanaerobaculia bacterium]
MTPWILAARPKTLSASIAPVLVGSAMAVHDGHPLRPAIFLCTLAGSILIQIATNYVNDALDFKKGSDTSARLGPLRVTQAGLLNASAVMRGAYIAIVFAALCGIPLIIRGGWPLLAIGAASIIAAYIYTGGPYPLAYNGLGELFVMLFFGLIAVGGTYYVQALTISVAVLSMGTAVGSLAIVLLAINNLRDIDNDRVSNKRTVAVRFGARFARFEIAAAALLPFAIVAILALVRRSWWLALPLVALPLAGVLLRKVAASSGAALNRCLALSGLLQWMFGILAALAWLA